MSRAIVCVMWIVMLLVSPLVVDADCPERVGHWPYGPTFAVEADGDTAYFGVGTVLRVADVSDPADPTVVAELEIGNIVEGLRISGSTLFVSASHRGLVTVDVSDPAKPVILDVLDLNAEVYELTVASGYAWVAGGYEAGMAVVDFSTRSQLEVVTTFREDSTAAHSVAVSGNLAVIADRYAGLRVVDVSDPTAPELLATLEGLDRPISVDLYGSYAYVAEMYDGVAVIDLTDPAAPGLVTRIDAGGSSYGEVYVASGRLFVGSTAGVTVYDLATPTAPAVLGTWTGAVCHDLVLTRDLLFAAGDHQGLQVVDASSPSSLERIGSVSAEAFVRPVGLSGTTAALDLWASSVLFLDISDPANLVECSRYTEGYPSDLVMADGYAYLISPGSLHIVDAGDPYDPQLAGEVEEGGQDVAVSNGLVALADTADGLRVVDATDPDSPQLVGQLDTEYSVNSLASSGSAVYIPEGNVGVHIIDVSTPSAPEEVGLLSLPNDGSFRIATGGGLLFVGDWGTGIRIYDLGDPFEPEEVALYDGVTRWGWLAYSDGLLLVAGVGVGLHVVDVSDPSNPVGLGEAPLLEDYPPGLAVDGRFAIVGDENAGAEVFDLGSCTSGAAAPGADFSWSPAAPQVGEAVQLTDTSTGVVNAWQWDFGDGGSSTAQNPSHAWAAEGTYDVTLVVTGPGGSDSKVQTVSTAGVSACVPGPTRLCLNEGRFAVEARYETSQGASGPANAVRLTSDTGYLWFFNEDNVEVVLKLLDGCGVNQHFWMFAAGLTDVEVEITVIDTATDAVQVYTNPQGTAFLPIQDTAAFTGCGMGASAGADLLGMALGGGDRGARAITRFATAELAASNGCTPDATTLCLNDGRFRVTAEWETDQGQSGNGQAVSLTSDTGYFWFFDDDNVEVIIKVLDACGVNQRYWVFAGGLTNVEVKITVQDTSSGETQTFVNPQGQAFEPLQDTGAFATCP